MRIKHLLLALVIVTGAHEATAEVEAIDVYHQVQHLAGDLALLHTEMGAIRLPSKSIEITNAQPREVYFQALTLFRKSNRLLFEQARERQPEPEASTGEITPAHVLNLVQQSHAMILRVKKHLSIPEVSIPDLAQAEKTPTDVFKLIVDQNRTLSRLLQQRFTPADVYQQVTYGVGIMSAVLGSFNIEPRLGVEPDYERRKVPADVYKRLINIHQTIRQVVDQAGGECLTIADFELQRTDVIPGDVYDLTLLVIAQLRYLYNNRPDAAPLRKDYYPGNRLPSHAFQRAGRLESQVDLLLKHTQLSPNWVK